MIRAQKSNLITNIFPKIVEYWFLMIAGEGRPDLTSNLLPSIQTKSFLFAEL